MSFKTIFAAALALAVLPHGIAWAQGAEDAAAAPPATLTIVIAGTAGPVLQGSDPLGLNGQSATITVLASESLKPVKHTKASATYKIPAGAITLDFDGTDYQTSSPSKMTVKLGKTTDTLTLVSAVTKDGVTVDFTDTTSLATDSWSNAALKHPLPFQPSPQTLTSPGSKLKYSAKLLGTTVVGVSGTASNSDAPDPVLPDDDE